MHLVKIEWVGADKGGRKSIPSEGKYYSVAKFPEYTVWQNNAWSVVFELEKKQLEGESIISFGAVDFLMDTAPKERMEKYRQFEIYEGPKKVADVFLIHN